MGTKMKDHLGPIITAMDPAIDSTTEMEQLEWSAVLAAGAESGALLVTNASRPEAVILGYDDFQLMRGALLQLEVRDVATLSALRLEFDERLAPLSEPGAGDRLRALAHQPVHLHGKVRAGTDS